MTDIEKGRTFNHRDGMSELERFEVPMTAEERARKIWNEIPRDLGSERGIDYLATQIQQAMAEADEKGQVKGFDKGYSRGFSDAREKLLAKVDGMFTGTAGPLMTDMVKELIRALDRDK